jgi:hypothetical protein
LIRVIVEAATNATAPALFDAAHGPITHPTPSGVPVLNAVISALTEIHVFVATGIVQIVVTVASVVDIANVCFVAAEPVKPI